MISSHAYFLCKIKMAFTRIFCTLETCWRLIMKIALDTTWESALFSLTVSLQLWYKWNQIGCKVKSTWQKYLQPSYIHILSNILVKAYFSQFSPSLNMSFTTNRISEGWSLLFLCGQIDKKLHNLKQPTMVWVLWKKEAYARTGRIIPVKKMSTDG